MAAAIKSNPDVVFDIAEPPSDEKSRSNLLITLGGNEGSRVPVGGVPAPREKGRPRDPWPKGGGGPRRRMSPCRRRRRHAGGRRPRRVGSIRRIDPIMAAVSQAVEAAASRRMGQVAVTAVAKPRWQLDWI